MENNLDIMGSGDAATEEAVFKESAPLEEVDIGGCQVLKRELVSLVLEPQITIRFNKISFNRACLRRLKGAEYVQILIAPKDRMLYVRPCGEDEKENIPWFRRGEGRVKLKTKQITCKEFYALLIIETGWNPSNNYKLIGRMVTSKREQILAFDLESKQAFPAISRNGQKIKRTTADLIRANSTEFGTTFGSLAKMPMIKTIKGHTVFTVRDVVTKVPPSVEEEKKDDN